MVRAVEATAEIEFDFGSRRKVIAAMNSVRPELLLPESSRCKVSLTHRKTVLCLRVEAQDTAALRAAVNSFIRLVKVAKDMIERCE